jgi:hypothetical protein
MARPAITLAKKRMIIYVVLSPEFFTNETFVTSQQNINK